MLGVNPDEQRLIIPYWKNSHWVYYNGRDLSGRPNVTKYKKCSLDSSIVAQNILWGFQTLNPSKRIPITYTASDGQVYETGRLDPRSYTLCVLEGMFDALSFAQENWQVLSPGSGLPSKLETPLVMAAKSYQQVFVCFDNDSAGQQFQKKISRLFLRNGINFICGHVPQIVNGQQCKDISDFYCAGGDLAQLVNNATPGLIECAQNAESYEELCEVFAQGSRHFSSEKIFELKEACYSLFNPKSGEPYGKKTINFLFLEACRALPEEDIARMVDEKHNLLFDNSGKFYEYARGVWSEIDDLVVQNYIAQVLGKKASSSRMRSVCHFLKASHIGSYSFNRKAVFVFRNGTLHLDVDDPQFRFAPSTADDMATQQARYDYRYGAQCPKWLAFLNTAMKGNAARVRLLQQEAGYVLFTDNRMQKMFYHFGDGRNGKSIFLNILRQVYGAENCVSLQPSRFSSQFDPILLKDAMMNFCFEANAVLAGEDAIKAIISGDPIVAAHKGVDAITFSPRAKIFVAANRLPVCNDSSWGMLRRIIFTKWDNVITDSQDNKNLYNELLEELPGIFNWCYAGYRDLVKSGEFQPTEDQYIAMAEFKDQMTPAMIFTREVLSSLEPKDYKEGEIYDKAKDWATDGGFKLPNRKLFCEELRQIIRQEKREKNLLWISTRVSVRTRQVIFMIRARRITKEELEHEGVIALGMGSATSGAADPDARAGERGHNAGVRPSENEDAGSVQCEAVELSGGVEDEERRDIAPSEGDRASSEDRADVEAEASSSESEGAQVEDEAGEIDVCEEQREAPFGQETEATGETETDQAGTNDVSAMAGRHDDDGAVDTEELTTSDNYSSFIDTAERIAELKRSGYFNVPSPERTPAAESYREEDELEAVKVYKECILDRMCYMNEPEAWTPFPTDANFWRLLKQYVTEHPEARGELRGLEYNLTKYLPEDNERNLYLPLK